VTLDATELPSHSHALQASSDPASNAFGPDGGLTGDTGSTDLYGPAANGTPLAPDAVSETGGGQSHPNLGPSLCVHFIIALVGIFPSRP
jgi:microcystin-dependent protein